MDVGDKDWPGTLDISGSGSWVPRSGMQIAIDLSNILNDLRGLDPSDPAWGLIQPAIQDLADLAATADETRLLAVDRNKVFRRLVDTIGRLQQDYAAELRYMETLDADWTETEGWNDCGLDALSRACSQIDTLEGLLAELRSALALPKSTAREDRARSEQTTQTAGAIETLIEGLLLCQGLESKKADRSLDTSVRSDELGTQDAGQHDDVGTDGGTGSAGDGRPLQPSKPCEPRDDKSGAESDASPDGCLSTTGAEIAPPDSHPWEEVPLLPQFGGGISGGSGNEVETDEDAGGPAEQGFEQGKERSSGLQRVKETESTRVTLTDEEAILARLLASGDTVSAYWAGRALGCLKPGLAVMPVWALEAAALASLAIRPTDRDNAALYLYEAYLEHPTPMEQPDDVLEALGLGGLAHLVALGSLLPTLTLPSSGANSWLSAAVSFAGPLQKLLACVSEFGRHGIALTPALIADLVSPVDWGRRSASAAEAVDEWREHTRSASLLYARASFALKHISLEGETGRILTAVAANQSDALPEVERIIRERLTTRAQRIELIDQAAAKAPGKGPLVRRIEGSALGQVIGKLGELKDRLDRWVLAVNNAQSKGNLGWEVERTQAFRSDLDSEIAAVQARAGSKSDDAGSYLGSESITACLWDQICSFAGSLSRAGHDGRDTGEDVTGASFDHVRSAMRRPLLLLSPVPAGDGWREAGLDARLSAEMLDRLDEGGSMGQAAYRHLEALDLGSARDAAAFAFADDRDALDQFAIQASEIAERAANEFDKMMADVRGKVVRAGMDQVLGDYEAAALTEELEALNERSEQEDADFGVMSQRLTDIARELSAMHERHLSSLKERVSQVRDAHKDPLPALARLMENIGEAFAGGNLAVAEELLTRIEEDDITDLPVQSGKTESLGDPGDMFIEFLHVFDALAEGLEGKRTNVRRALASGKSAAGVRMSNVPGARRNEIQGMFRDVEMLRAQRNVGPTARTKSEIHNAVRGLLNYLGFLPRELVPKSFGRNYGMYDARMSDASQSPVRQLGSDRGGRYSVFVAWERPSVESLMNLLSEEGALSSAPIVLYPYRFTRMQRNEILRECVRRQATVVLVDELLLTFLAGERGSRLKSCLACSLPFTYADPYTPFSGGNVPAELFRGRDHLIQGLWDAKGPSVVYGGRQLGKSALLRAVQRRYHDPESQRYVMYADIKNLGAPGFGTPPDDLWRELHEFLVAQGLLLAGIVNPQTLLRKVRALFDDRPFLHVRVLLDEADKFLDADVKEDFPVLHDLKRLHEDTQGRLKVVFAGLHSVQRFHNHQNHPFAHMAPPVVVGPLPLADGVDLVRTPLEAVGFRFNDDLAVFSILSYTNCHPALIQAFCQAIVKRHLGKMVRPRFLSVENIEEVYRGEALRKLIRERFEWTLMLDHRYEVLVYTMVADQLEERDGFRKQYTSREALEMAKGMWPEGFSNSRADDGERFMVELQGLGVLVSHNGKYRLRNGNVSRALGSVDDIEGRLLELSQLPAPSEFDPAVQRRVIDATACVRSPLTFEQEGRLLAYRSGIHGVFVTEALGGDNLAGAIQSLVQKRLPQGGDAFERLPPDIVNLEKVVDWLRMKWKGFKSGHLVIFTEAADIERLDPGLRHSLESISAYIGSLRANEKFVSFIVAAHADDQHMWFSLRGGIRDSLESKMRSVIVSGRWLHGSVEQLLTEERMLHVDTVIRDVVVKTGGWPFLIQELVDRLRRDSGGYLTNVDPRAALAELTKDLVDPASEIRQQFRASLGMRYDDPDFAVLQMIFQLQPVFPESSLVSFLESLTAEEVAEQVEHLVRLGLVDRTPQGLVCEPVAVEIVLAER